MIYKGVDISLARRDLIVGKLTQKGHSAGYLKSLRAQLKQLDAMRLLYNASKSEQPSPPSSPAAQPVADTIDAQTEYLYNQFRGLGITKDTELATASAGYQKAYLQYQQDKPYYAQNWQKIYGASMPEFGFRDNPFAMAAVSGGTYAGYNLADLATKASLLTKSTGIYSDLATGGSWAGGAGQLGYEQFRELASMFGETTPTQGEFAQLKTPGSTYQYQGADWSAWSSRYEDWRKKRQTLYSPEEGKVSYQNTDEGFTAAGLKSRQQY